MKNLTVKGSQKFMGKEIPVVAGGFGENAKCISDKTVAEIHKMEVWNIRARITDNIKRFKDGIDYIDMKQRLYQTKTLRSEGAGESHTLELLQSLGYPGGAYLSLIRTRLCKAHQDYGHRPCLGNPR